MRGYRLFHKDYNTGESLIYENLILDKNSEFASIEYGRKITFRTNPIKIINHYGAAGLLLGEFYDFAEVESVGSCSAVGNGIYSAEKVKINKKIDFAHLLQISLNDAPYNTYKKIMITSSEQAKPTINLDNNIIINGLDRCRNIITSGDNGIILCPNEKIDFKFGDKNKIYCVGNKNKIISLELDTEIYSSGDENLIGSSGYGVEINSIGGRTHIGSSGDYANISASGYYVRIASAGSYDKISYSGTDGVIHSSGDNVTINVSASQSNIYSSGNNAIINSSGVWTRITSLGENAIICCSGDDAEVRAKKGSWITFTNNRLTRGNYSLPHNFSVKTIYIDGKKYKADTTYLFRDNKIIVNESGTAKIGLKNLRKMYKDRRKQLNKEERQNLRKMYKNRCKQFKKEEKEEKAKLKQKKEK